MKGNNTIPIGGELESKATGGVVVSADGVYDYKRDANLETVIDDLIARIEALEGDTDEES